MGVAQPPNGFGEMGIMYAACRTEIHSVRAVLEFRGVDKTVRSRVGLEEIRAGVEIFTEWIFDRLYSIC